MNPLRIWLVGTGMVGRWLAGVLDSQREWLTARYGLSATVVGIASARGGFVYDPSGLDLASAPAAAPGGRPVADRPGTRHWPSTIEGLRATEADLLVEVSASPPADGEPGVAHMREALQRRIPVVTSNKWPVALHGVELAALARSQGVAFRAESTVMSAGGRVKHVATLGFAGPEGAGGVTASVQPELVRDGDPLAHVDGTANAVVFEASPVGQVTITGPGAGPRLAGQGVLSDIIAVASRPAGCS